MSNNLINKKDIQPIYNKLTNIYNKNLAKEGVKMPPLRVNGGKYNNRALQLVYLWRHFQMPVHRDAIATFVRRFNPGASGDQQPRHLAHDGWDVRLSGRSPDEFRGERVPNGYNVLASTGVKAAYLKNRTKRLGILSATNWKKLQAAYHHQCGVCGEQPGKLEKGHMDPNKRAELKNIIPLCGNCNNWASDRVVLNKRGRVIALASPALVMASSGSVQLEIFEALRAQFGFTLAPDRETRRTFGAHRTKNT